MKLRTVLCFLCLLLAALPAAALAHPNHVVPTQTQAQPPEQVVPAAPQGAGADPLVIVAVLVGLAGVLAGLMALKALQRQPSAQRTSADDKQGGLEARPGVELRPGQ